MTLIDADKFLAYLIFSKHVDRLTCGELKEAIEKSKVDSFESSEFDDGYAKGYSEALQKPFEKFENVKDHIYKLAGDYKCWDNRLTDDEALELCHILEQQSVPDKMRAEIHGMYRVVLKDTPKDDWAVRWNDCIDEVLQIIDKYKAENGE